ncbi:hypothetical protein D2T31_17510 [Sinirhodobacter populi]|uniref:Apea-like HEPN domain-containing protein n=1 Tax=Paenirhodobacter populi TaxID=2306993 RepID=A0A443K3B4_9RHOB|nr:hypothetical protein [Sinirhodobacter populi]RWR27260.1 hypothetical protein D2T31_17510 [Sinirhodobacter populi]
MAQIIELPRQADGEGFYIYFTGGFRAAKVADDAWRIEPIFANDKPCAAGPLTKIQLQSLVKQNNFQAVAFHRFGWVDGAYHSSWAPIIPNKTNHLEGPASLWSNIAGNIARPRTKDFFESSKSRTGEEIAKAIDDQHPVEALARYISLSLRSMDISVEQIAVHYHEQLVNRMASGRLDHTRSSNTLSQTLYAHVHSFFLHLGAARDYLGALVAYRIGLDPKKFDSMARLVGELRYTNSPADPLLALLLTSGNIVVHPQSPNKFQVSGWMQEVTALRNELVHKRPYGSKYNERAGWVVTLQKEAGLFRYFRPLEINGKAEKDVFDVLHHHYVQCTSLMHECAKASGQDTAMMHITDRDVISLEVQDLGKSDI